jgi:hypothetical protein
MYFTVTPKNANPWPTRGTLKGSFLTPDRRCWGFSIPTRQEPLSSRTLPSMRYNLPSPPRYTFTYLIGPTAASPAKRTSPAESLLSRSITWTLHPLTATPIRTCLPSDCSPTAAAAKPLWDAAQSKCPCIPDAADVAHDADADANEHGHGHGVAVWHAAVTGNASERHAAS